jgi:Ca2+-transporting ATPase
MVTGDKAATGLAIARRVGMADEGEARATEGRDLPDPESLTRQEDYERLSATTVFARVSPEQKLNLVRVYQEHGETVAMTGDGVNDAPALRKADIGVAMGRRGTDAARQVADMVLRDDNLASIVAAVREGRIIFANIRKSVMFMLCTNVAEIIAVALASLAGVPLPLRPLQILYLNVITDVFPALALGVGKGSARVMDQRPRDPGEAVLTAHHWKAVAAWSSLIAATVLAALWIARSRLELEVLPAVTVSFLTLAFGKLWFVFNLRDRGTRLLASDVVRNPWIWGALALCSGLLLLAVLWPPLAGVLETANPGVRGGLVALGLSLLPAAVGLLAPGIGFYATRRR